MTEFSFRNLKLSKDSNKVNRDLLNNSEVSDIRETLSTKKWKMRNDKNFFVSVRSGASHFNESEYDEIHEGDNVKAWYQSKYPTDELAEYIDPELTFIEMYQRMEDHEDVYDILGEYSDSIMRERVFEMLAEAVHSSYSEIYDLWLESADEITRNDLVPEDANFGEIEMEDSEGNKKKYLVANPRKVGGKLHHEGDKPILSESMFNFHRIEEKGVFGKNRLHENISDEIQDKILQVIDKSGADINWCEVPEDGVFEVCIGGNLDNKKFRKLCSKLDGLSSFGIFMELEGHGHNPIFRFFKEESYNLNESEEKEEKDHKYRYKDDDVLPLTKDEVVDATSALVSDIEGSKNPSDILRAAADFVDNLYPEEKEEEEKKDVGREVLEREFSTEEDKELKESLMKLKEGPGAGYKLYLDDLKLDLSTLKIIEDKDDYVTFMVAIKDGVYSFHTEHSYWDSEGEAELSGVLTGYYEGDDHSRGNIQGELPLEISIEDWYGSGYSISFPDEYFTLGNDNTKYSIGENWDATFVHFSGKSSDLGSQIEDAFNDWSSDEEYDDDPELEDDLDGIRGERLGESYEHPYIRMPSNTKNPDDWDWEHYDLWDEEDKEMYPPYDTDEDYEVDLDGLEFDGHEVLLNGESVGFTGRGGEAVFNAYSGCPYEVIDYFIDRDFIIREPYSESKMREYVNSKDRDFFNFVCRKHDIEKSEELEDFFSMLTSVFTYNGEGGEESIMRNRYIQKYNVPEDIKRIFVKEIIKYGEVERDTYTDSEGLTYSSLGYRSFEESIRDNHFDEEYSRNILGRLISDCRYVLGACQEHANSEGKSNKGALRHLWGGSVDNHIEEMRYRYHLLVSNGCDVSITEKDIDDFERALKELEGLKEALKTHKDYRKYSNEEIKLDRFNKNGMQNDVVDGNCLAESLDIDDEDEVKARVEEELSKIDIDFESEVVGYYDGYLIVEIDGNPSDVIKELDKTSLNDDGVFYEPDEDSIKFYTIDN